MYEYVMTHIRMGRDTHERAIDTDSMMRSRHDTFMNEQVCMYEWVVSHKNEPICIYERDIDTDSPMNAYGKHDK